jgi:Arc/MetJ-type ribon-helix-helix transcriptional regulator
MARAKKKAPPARLGRTEKVSISLDRELLARMRERAATGFDGNLSAVIEEGARRALEEEGREALAKWLTEGGVRLTGEEAERIRAEWRGESAKPARRRHRAA